MKKILILCIVVPVIFIIVGCEKTSKVNNYKYATINTSMKKKSILSFYSSEGKLVQEKKIKYGGISLSGFNSIGEDTGNYIYYSMPLTGNKVNHNTLEINKKTLETKEIKLSNETDSTFFTVDKNNLYSGTMLNGSIYISKTDIKKNKLLISSKTDSLGIGLILLENGDNLYLISFNNMGQKISKLQLSILNKSDLKIKKTITLGNGTSASDAKILNDKIYILKDFDGNDKLSNEIIVYDLKNNSIKYNKLLFNNLHQLINKKNYIYIIESESHGDKTQNRVAKYDLNSGKIKVFKCKRNLLTSYIQDDKFISSDGYKIDIYNLDNFHLVKSFDLKQYKDKVFTSFFINN